VLQFPGKRLVRLLEFRHPALQNPPLRKGGVRPVFRIHPPFRFVVQQAPRDFQFVMRLPGGLPRNPGILLQLLDACVPALA
jgi:hypothetical protein